MTVFTRYVKSRIKNNKNFMMNITGPTGSGKSTCALKLGENIDPRGFNADKVVFTPLEFIEAIENGRKGEVIVHDEVGVGSGRRDWYTVSNKMMHAVSQIFRVKRLVIFQTAPLSEFVDSGLIKLLHAIAETVSINYDKKYCTLKIFKLQYNERLKKQYFHYLLHRDNGVVHKIKRVHVGLPSEELIKEYEKKKRKYVKETIRGAKKALIEIERKEKKRVINYKQIANRVLKNKDDYIKTWGNRTIVDWRKIANDFNIGQSSAQRIQQAVKSKLGL